MSSRNVAPAEHRFTLLSIIHDRTPCQVDISTVGLYKISSMRYVVPSRDNPHGGKMSSSSPILLAPENTALNALFSDSEPTSTAAQILQVADIFTRLPYEERVVFFKTLRVRRQTSEQNQHTLAELLMEIGKALRWSQPHTFSLLQAAWAKYHHEAGFASLVIESLKELKPVHR